MRFVWFSCGAASAVAAKLAVERYGSDVTIVYCDTLGTEHEDNARFFADVERWIGRSIWVIKSTRYTSVDDVFEKTRYMSGVAGARCTMEMKKVPREALCAPEDIHIFGYTSDEQRRADRFEDNNPSTRVDWLLIDEGVSKERCLEMIAEAGIALPAMYALGFDHNNCKGCVKSQSAGYWNLTRRLFPDVFEKRVHQSRLLGVRLVRIRLPSDPPSKQTPRHFLDELPPDADAPQDDIDCGPMCQMPQQPDEDA